MKSLRGLCPVFAVRFCSAAAFSTIMSSLVLYLNESIGYSEPKAIELVGMFLSFHFILPLLGGYLGNRLVNFKHLYSIGMLFQFVGITLLAFSSMVNIPLAFYLMGSMVSTVTTLMVINQYCEGDEYLRRKAIQFNYTGSNVGFLCGFFLSGYIAQTANLHVIYKVFL